jgi:hypothetical protein
MAVFFAIFGRINGLQHLAAVLSVRNEVPASAPAASKDTAQPQDGRVRRR